MEGPLLKRSFITAVPDLFCATDQSVKISHVIKPVNEYNKIK